MAYDREIMYQKAKDVIVKQNIFFMAEVPVFLGIATSTFYEWFPDKSEELEALKDLLALNKVKIKQSLRNKWYNGDNSTTQLALYKLLATPEELRSLSMNTVGVEGDVNITWEEIKTYDSEDDVEGDETE